MRRTSSESHAKSMSADRPKIRAVFDCMVFLQGAARRESAGGACLFLVELNAIELCLSDEIMAGLPQHRQVEQTLYRRSLTETTPVSFR
jgi:hypothetical protein